MSSKIMSINQLSCASLLMLQCFKIKIIEVCFGYSWEGMDKLSTAPNSRVQCNLFFFKVSGAAWMVTCKKATKVLGMHQLTFMLSHILLPVQYDKPFEMCANSRPVSFLVLGYIIWCSYIVTLARRLFILCMFLTILIFILLHIRCLDLANCWYKILCADHGERLMFLLTSLPSG